MKQFVKIKNKNIAFKATAATTYLYKQTFGTDLLRDLQNIKEDAQTEIELKPVFQLAFIMAKQADKSIPDDFYKWLDGFEVFDILGASKQILRIWERSCMTSSLLKKKKGR